MPEYVAWLKALPGKPVFVGYPVAYDFMFVYWYLIAFAVLGTEYRESTKRNMPKAWFDPIPHTHIALDDAKGQGALFCNMLAAAKKVSR